MADRIELQHGHMPWRPSLDSELVATYRYYDGPLTGVISQHGNEYVFSCLDGEVETLSLWFFASIDQGQRERLEAMGPDEFQARFAHESWHGCIVLAFATERLGIVDWESVEDSDDAETQADNLRHAFRVLRRRLDELGDDASHLELTLA